GVGGGSPPDGGTAAVPEGHSVRFRRWAARGHRLWRGGPQADGRGAPEDAGASVAPAPEPGNAPGPARRHRARGGLRLRRGAGPSPGLRPQPGNPDEERSARTQGKTPTENGAMADETSAV